MPKLDPDDIESNLPGPDLPPSRSTYYNRQDGYDQSSSTAPDSNTTQAFGNAINASGSSVQEHWMRKYWRPAMAWVYMVTCICDFIIFPVLWAMVQLKDQAPGLVQWNPLTLQNGGLYHLAMGAVLGIASYSRGKEKLADVQNR